MNNELTVKNKTELKEEEKTYNCKIFVPDVDIYEMKDTIVLTADMPGVKKDRVDVDLKDNVLRIKGHIEPAEYDGLKTIYGEYNVGHYERKFHLSDDINQEKIEAKMENGVLTLKLSKIEKFKAKNIVIQ